jgi:Zn finger protein HypA/HybF involved in hydrogenase expression
MLLLLLRGLPTTNVDTKYSIKNTMLILTKTRLRRPCDRCKQMFIPTTKESRVCPECWKGSKTWKRKAKHTQPIKHFCRKCGIFFQSNAPWNFACPSCTKEKKAITTKVFGITQTQIASTLRRSSKFKLKVDDAYQIMK